MTEPSAPPMTHSGPGQLREPARGPRKTAFVLAGGGSLGAVEVGMLKALVAQGIVADLVVGSSVGAINAAYFAADPTPRGLEQLEKVWRTTTRAMVFPLPSVSTWMHLLSGADHVLDASALAAHLRRHLPCERLEQAAIPCCIVTTDLLEGIEVRLHTGPVVDALLASTALPGIFPPVVRDGRHLVDGGVCNNTPISAALELGAERIYVLPTGYSCALEAPPHGVVARALHGLNLLITRQLINEVKRLRSQAEIVVVPPLCPVTTSPYDFDAAGSLIERAESATQRFLSEGSLLIDGIPEEMPPHTHRAATDPYAPEWR
jgi:NTE family protein